MHNDCKECLNSRLVVSENGYKAICTLSSIEAKKCLLNNKCKFEGNQLYLMSKQDLIDIQNMAHLKGEEE